MHMIDDFLILKCLQPDCAVWAAGHIPEATGLDRFH